MANLLRVLLISLVAEHPAPRHDLKVSQLRETADQAISQAVAEVFIPCIGGRIDKGQHRDGVDVTGLVLSAQKVRPRPRRNHHNRSDIGDPVFTGMARPDEPGTRRRRYARGYRGVRRTPGVKVPFQAFQIRSQLCRALVPQIAIFLQSLAD